MEASFSTGAIKYWESCKLFAKHEEWTDKERVFLALPFPQMLGNTWGWGGGSVSKLLKFVLTDVMIAV